LRIFSDIISFYCFRVIDFGSEWRTFSNDMGNADPSRVGGTENPLLNGSDLSTVIGGGKGEAAFDEFGVSKYQNRRPGIPARERVRTNFFSFLNYSLQSSFKFLNLIVIGSHVCLSRD